MGGGGSFKSKTLKFFGHSANGVSPRFLGGSTSSSSSSSSSSTKGLRG